MQSGRTTHPWLYLGYCYRWMKAIDYATQTGELLAKATPVQRQLLGDASGRLSYYLPGCNDFADVPLKKILETRLHS